MFYINSLCVLKYVREGFACLLLALFYTNSICLNELSNFFGDRGDMSNFKLLCEQSYSPGFFTPLILSLFDTSIRNDEMERAVIYLVK